MAPSATRLIDSHSAPRREAKPPALDGEKANKIQIKKSQFSLQLSGQPPKAPEEMGAAISCLREFTFCPDLRAPVRSIIDCVHMVFWPPRPSILNRSIPFRDVRGWPGSGEWEDTVITILIVMIISIVEHHQRPPPLPLAGNNTEQRGESQTDLGFFITREPAHSFPFFDGAGRPAVGK